MMRRAVYILSGAMALAAAGCDQSDTTAEAPPSTQPSPGGAPTFGTPTGTGYSTGDAANSDGQGSGLMGYHDTGAAGTSGTITDTHELPPPPATTDPVLPPA